MDETDRERQDGSITPLIGRINDDDDDGSAPGLYINREHAVYLSICLMTGKLTEFTRELIRKTKESIKTKTAYIRVTSSHGSKEQLIGYYSISIVQMAKCKSRVDFGRAEHI
jgi:hypothetical protein